jgi:signal transduction histidine kinase
MSSLVDDLRAIRVFSDLPQDGLEWLASRMVEVRLQVGEAFLREGEPADKMIVILEGEVHGRAASEAADVPMYLVRGGEVTGKLPYSRMTYFPVTGRAVVPSRLAWLGVEHFDEMLKRMPMLGPKLVGVMADRIRSSTKMVEQRERLAALGKLSAGLAHELNNPASAARRSADGLRETFQRLRAANRQLDAYPFSNEQRAFLAGLEQDHADCYEHQPPADSLERSDREDEISQWMESRGVEHAPGLAGDLAEEGLSVAKLDRLAGKFPVEILGPVLVRISTTFQVNRLISEIEHSTGRISELVRSIKEYSHMDQSSEQETDLHQGLESTLTMLRHRLKNGVQVIREFDRTLPKICARPGELNQVWTNLIDNAVQAMNGNGILRIRTVREPGWALVEIGDNGPGIPPELQRRMFEPFFTTKPVGEGMGLGLDTVYRIISTHRGTVSFESQPGDTRFQVRLPAPEPKGEYA